MVKWMRKGLTLALALSCALFTAACGGGGSNDGNGGGEGAPASTPAPAAFSLEEQELFNDNGIILRCMGGSLKSGRYLIDFEVENVDASYREVVIAGIAFNGLYLPCTSTMAFADKGETGEPDVEVSQGAVELAGIKSIDTITILFSSHDEDYKYDAESLPIDVKVASASGDGSYGITASNDVILDAGGLTVSYQGNKVAEDGSFRGYFLVNNATNESYALGTLGEAHVSGGAGDDLDVSLWSPVIPAGSSALVDLRCIAYDSGKNDFDAIDLTATLTSEGPSIKMPLHLERTGDELAVEAGEPTLPEGFGEKASAAEDSTSSAATGADPDNADDLEVSTCGFFGKDKGSNTLSAEPNWVTFGICAVDNPNDGLWAYSFDIVYTFYDEDGNEVATTTSTGQYLEPGYAHPFLSRTVESSVPVASAEARIENAKFVEERKGLYLHNDNMVVRDTKLGTDGKAISSTYLAGKLENKGEAADDAQVTLVLYDEDFVPVYGYSFRVKDIPAEGSVDFEERLGIGLELPAYDSATIDVMTKSL